MECAARVGVFDRVTTTGYHYCAGDVAWSPDWHRSTSGNAPQR
jgi:hypothetical protein